VRAVQRATSRGSIFGRVFGTTECGQSELRSSHVNISFFQSRRSCDMILKRVSFLLGLIVSTLLGVGVSWSAVEFDLSTSTCTAKDNSNCSTCNSDVASDNSCTDKNFRCQSQTCDNSPINFRVCQVVDKDSANSHCKNDMTTSVTCASGCKIWAGPCATGKPLACGAPQCNPAGGTDVTSPKLWGVCTDL
jgi:hypothetical protein